MRRDTFVVRVGDTNKKYVTQDADELDKKHKADCNPDDTIGEARMYETDGPL